MLDRVGIECLEWMIRTGGRLRGHGRFPDPLRSFEDVGGVDAAEAELETVHDRFLEWLLPVPGAERSAHALRERHDDEGVLEWTMPSPRPSGVAPNDTARARWIGDPGAAADGRCLVFHHAIYQRDWSRWRKFLEPLSRRIPVLFVEAPWHFRRRAPGERPGQRTIDPNPLNLYRAVRQWVSEQPAWIEALGARGLNPAAIVGFSLGGFQTLLASSAGVLDFPIVTIATTNDYGWGLTRGYSGRPVLRAMARAGIDEERFVRMVRSAAMHRYVDRIEQPVLFIEGLWDRVDPYPSIDRLKRVLNPRRNVRLRGGHGTLLLFRERIAREILEFTDELAGARAPAERTSRASSLSAVPR